VTEEAHELEGVLAAARAGRADALDELAELSAGRLWRVARRLASEADAEEAVQIALVRAVEKLGSFRGDGRALWAWMERTTVNAAIDLARAGARAREHEPRAAAPSGPPTPSEAAEAAELRRAVELAAMRLPEGERAVFVLHDLEGRSSDEVARVLRVSGVQVRVQLCRARKKMRAALKPFLEAEGES